MSGIALCIKRSFVGKSSNAIFDAELLFHRFIVSEKGNERRGFVEEPEYRLLVERTAGQLWLRGLLALGYNFGFHKAELLEMRCSRVDLLNNIVSLYSGETKNGEPRIVVLTEECRQLVTELRRGKKPEDYLFTREDSQPIRDFAEHGTPC